jgi:hypothetical protein
MKTLIKSLLTIAVVAVATVQATGAYFTSTVTAADNQLTTGTLRLGVASTAFGGGNSGYWVAYDDGVSTVDGPNIPTVTNMEPGVERSVYVAVANIGSLSFDYRAFALGEWTSNTSLDDSYVSVVDVERYPAGNCMANVECEDIYYWLTGAGYTHVGPVWASGGPVTGMFGSGTVWSDGNFTLAPQQFAVYKVDVMLSTAADNTYQGQTYEYDLVTQAKQLIAPWTP